MIERSADGGEVLLGTLGVRLHGLFTRSPVGRANLVGVGLHVLEGLQNAKGFINVPSHRQVVDGGVHDHTVGVDDEQTTQGNTLSLVENVVGRRDFLLQVGNEGIVDIAQATLIARGLDPGQVAELAVHGNAENLGVLAGEIRVAVAEGRDLSGAISFYYNFTGFLVFLLWSWSGGWSEAWRQNLEMLLLLGLLGIIQQVMLTYSFRYAEASLLAPFDYLSLPLALLFGFWFWNEFPDWMSLLGSAVIVLSGMMLMVGQWKGLFSAAKFDRN